MRRIAIHNYSGHPPPIQLSRELARRGHHVSHLYAANLQTPRGDLTRRATDPEGFVNLAVPMSAAYPRLKYKFARRWWLERAYATRLARWIEAERPGLFVSSDAPLEVQAAALDACRRCSIPSVFWLQDLYSQAVLTLPRGWYRPAAAVLGRLYRLRERQILRRSSSVVTISPELAEVARAWGAPEDRLTLVPNWAPLDELPVMQRDNAWARRHDLLDRFCFLYAGTLGLKHDLEPLLALARTLEDDERARLVILSEGIGARRLVERKATLGLKSLMILDFQPWADMPAILASADVLVLVLNDAGALVSVPSKVYTSLCAQRPILASAPSSNLAGRLLIENDMGLVAEPGDLERFLAHASALRSDGGLRARLAANARAHAEAQFDITTITDQFVAIFERAIRVGA